ncbi:matrixin family metalloprotease [Pendulispora albinea]|uniref:Matrixin family metalloprotease n=2 Tax=Pendulispora albinea TaxID=2741071 RepID=A0ABZ2MCH6_9BACT
MPHAPSADRAEGGATREPVRTYRIRAYATTTYAAQTIDWKRRLSDLLDDANRVLGPAIGARLQLDECRSWGLASEDDLPSTLASLRSADAGADVDWVIGLVGALPRLSSSFHDIGVAEIDGKHVILRAAGELGELAAAEQNFEALQADERAELVRARKRHRAVAVLLHEIGHTLGAIHTRDPRSLMSPQYDSHMDAYGDPSTSLMRATLSHRNDMDLRSRARAQLTILDGAPETTWIPSERNATRARLRNVLEPSPQPTTAPAEKPLPNDIAALPENDRSLYLQALRAYENGDITAAYDTGRPLFGSRPDVYSVQDLRCKLALAAGGAWSGTRAECEALMKIAGPKSDASPKKRSR